MTSHRPRRWRQLPVGRALLGVADVALLSASSFAMSLLVLNLASARQYGLYVNLLALLMLCVAIHRALITTPLTFLGARAEAAAQAALLRGLWWLQLAMLVPVAAAAVVLAALLPGTITVAAGLALAALVVLFPTREFLRSRGYLLDAGGQVLMADLTFAAVALAALASHGMLAAHTGATHALWALAAASLTALLVLLWRGPMVRTPSRIEVQDAWRQVRGPGSWSTPHAAAGWALNSAHTWLAAAVISLETTAVLAASRVALTPVTLLATGLHTVWRPRWTRELASGVGGCAPAGMGARRSVMRQTLNVLWFTLACIAVYVSLLAIAWPAITRLLYGGRFADAVPLVLAWGGYLAVQAARSRLGLLLQMYTAFRPLATVTVVVACVAMPATAAGLWLAGALGGVLAMAAAECLLAVLLWQQLRWTLRSAAAADSPNDPVEALAQDP